MAARTTGFAMLCASSVQETADFAAVAHATTLDTASPVPPLLRRVPHESRDRHDRGSCRPTTLRAMIDPAAVRAHRARGLDPDRPVLRGSAQNPDVFFQAREACNPFYARVPGAVQASMDQLATRTGRQYHLVDYHGAPDADRVIVLMGSGAGATKETVDELCRHGERVGVAVVRLFRPFPTEALLAALPPSTRTVVVLDRTKEPGAPFEPLHLDVLSALWHSRRATWVDGRTPRVIGGRYGLEQQGVHSGDGQGGVRRSRDGLTAQRVHCRDHRRRHPHQPDVRSVLHDRQRPGARRVLRTRLRRHRRCEQEHGEDRRQEHRPGRAGLLRVRLEEVGLDDGQPPPIRPRRRSRARISSTGRRSSACTSGASSSGSTCSALPRPARRC